MQMRIYIVDKLMDRSIVRFLDFSMANMDWREKDLNFFGMEIDKFHLSKIH